MNLAQASELSIIKSMILGLSKGGIFCRTCSPSHCRSVSHFQLANNCYFLGSDLYFFCCFYLTNSLSSFSFCVMADVSSAPKGPLITKSNCLSK